MRSRGLAGKLSGKLPGVVCALTVAALAGGCAAPPALQIASFAVDGAAYLATGKGSTDHALSLVAEADCRLSNVVRGRAVCAAPKKRDGAPDSDPVHADAIVTPAAPMPAHAHALAPPVVGAFAAAPPVPAVRVAFQESAGMNLVEIEGAALGAALAGTVDDAGTLHVRLASPDGTPEAAVLFTVPGYARAPGRFTGVVMGARFLAPESFIR